MIISYEFPIYPNKSDAGIGWYFCKCNPPDELYGKIQCGVYFGKYLFSYSSRLGFHFCDYFATGCGG